MENRGIAGSIVVLGICILIASSNISSSLDNYRAVTSQGNISDQVTKSTDLLLLPEVAIYLNIPEEKLTDMVSMSVYSSDLGIPFFKIDGGVMFSKKALDA